MVKENQEWLSIAELSKKSGIADSTTRRYLTKFDKFFRYEERSRGRKYDPASVEIVTLIQSLFTNDRLEAEEIETVLSKQFPMTVPTDPLFPTTVPHLPTVATKADVDELRIAVETMQEAMKAMREENLTLYRQLGDRLEERDRVVTETLRVILDAKKELAVADEEVVKKPWWKFFKRGSEL